MANESSVPVWVSHFPAVAVECKKIERLMLCHVLQNRHGGRWRGKRHWRI